MDDGTAVQVEGRKGLTCRLLLALSSCVIGASFQFGYHTGVVNDPQQVIESYLNETYTQRYGIPMPESTRTMLWSLIVAIYAIGGMIGGFSAGFLANRFGRKKTMLLNNILIFLGAFLMFSSKVLFRFYEILLVGRFVIGVSCGISTGVAPLYLAEIAPISFRGAAGTLNQFAICVAIVVSQVLGLEPLLGNSWGWPYLMGITLFPAVYQLLTLPFCPESPRYLYISKENTQGAEKALQWLRGVHDVDLELREMEQEKSMSEGQPKVSILDLFRQPLLRQPLLISVVMQLSQQLSGINAVIFYSTSIFVGAGLTHQVAQYATIGTGVVNVVMTFVSAILVDRAGRRTLHLYGLGGMWIFSTLLTVTFLWRNLWTSMSILSIVCIVMYIVFFASGPGSIPWFIVAELFEQGPRSAAMGIAVLVNWLANFLVGICFPLLQKSLHDYSFVPFIFLLSVFWLFTFLRVPETKNKSIEEITQIFKARHGTIQNKGYEPLKNEGEDS